VTPDFAHPVERAIAREGRVGEPGARPRAGSGLGLATRLDIQEERADHGVVLALQGDADLHGAPELRDRLAEAISNGVGRIVVDLSSVSFIDSMALGVLLGARHRLRVLDGDLRLVVGSPDLRRIFELSLLDRVFDLDRTRGEALEQLAAGAP
jgi:anti-sigma B factor antagonist